MIVGHRFGAAWIWKLGKEVVPLHVFSYANPNNNNIPFTHSNT